MAFKIIDNPEFTRDVEVTLPDGTVMPLTTEFRGMRDEEAEHYDVGKRDQLTEFLGRVVIAFDDVEDDEGKVGRVVPGEPLFEKILRTSYVRVALTGTYFQAMNGVKGPRRGN